MFSAGIFIFLFGIPLNDAVSIKDTHDSNRTKRSLFSQEWLDNIDTSTLLSSTITTEQITDSTTFSYISTSSLSDSVKSSEQLGAKDNLELLIQFLELQIRACPYVRLCTLHEQTIKPVIGITEREKECCHRCSCSENCLENNDCCPDYYLYTILTRKYYSFDELKNALPTKKFLNVKLMLTLNRASVISNRTHSECIKTHLKSITRVFVPASGYKLITTCSVTYPADQTRHKCENNISNNTAAVTDYIPVYSTNTSQSYKNIYCLICNGLLPYDSRAWQGVLRCSSHNYSALPFFTNANRLIQYMLKEDNALPNCNIVFEPLTEFDTESCTFVNRNTCTSRPEGQTNAEWTNLRRMCEQFELPVDRIYKTIDTYRNIACFYCIHGPYFKDKCKDIRNVYQTYDIVIDANYLKIDDDNFENTLNKTFGKNEECRTGYIQDLHKDCRKVLCPRGMYVSKGGCVLMINTFTSQTYSCIFKIKLFSEGYELDKMEESYLEKEVIKLSIDRMEKLSIRLYSDYSLYYFASSKLFLLYVVLNDADGLGTRYAIDKFSQMNEELSNGIMEVNENKIGFRSEIFSDAHIRPNGYMDVYDFKNNYRPYILFKIHNANATNKPAMPITKAHFCSRIKLDKENVTYHEHFIKINESEKEIPMQDIDFDSEDEKPITCIDVLEMSKRIKAQPKKDKASSESGDSISDTAGISTIDYEKGVYPIAAIVGLTICVLVLRKVLNSRYHNDICKSD